MLFAAAVERETPKGFGRVRLGVIEDAGAQSLRGFLVDNVEPGSRVITDGWSSYPPATEGLYKLAPTTVSGSGMEAHELLPGPHVVFSLVKRWVLGTLQRVRLARAPAGVLRRMGVPLQFNRRRSRSRGLLFYRLMSHAAAGEPLTYRDLRKAGRTRPPPPAPPGARPAPPSLDLGDVGLPWREDRTG